MQAVMNRSNGRCAAGMRLVQAAFHNRSLSLYASVGFEPLSCVQGQTLERSVPGSVVRPAQPSDLDACNVLSRRDAGRDGRGRGPTQPVEHLTRPPRAPLVRAG